jgi:3-hydroxybutyrate dehydrogenase
MSSPAPPPRRALVTGGGRGIGRGISDALASSGYHVAIAARSGEELDRAAAECAGPGRPVPLTADLAEPRACADLAERAAEALSGTIDVFVHSAGIARAGAVGELGLEDWELSMRVNVTAAFVLAGKLLPAMARAGWGRVISIGSLYSRFGVREAAPYTASKHALLGLTRVIAAEHVRHGITANTIVPGFVDTEMVRGEARRVARERDLELDDVLERFLRNQPIGRMVATEEVGALAAYLCSDAAAAVTGQAINIDGGSYQA